MTTKLLIDRELLERIRDLLYIIAHRQDDYGVEADCIGSFLPAILAYPRQPEGGLPEPDFALDGGAQPCYYAETAQRAIAELREECERLRNNNGLVAHANLLRAQQAETERDTLRQQLAERDAAIEEWSGTAVQNGMECDRLRQQRDKLAGLLNLYRNEVVPDDLDERIDAALAEVEKAR